MKTLRIPIHSFVDLITNSSTEIYIQADESTISGIKDIVNGILLAAKSELKADDLFSFDLIAKHNETNVLVTAKEGVNVGSADRILSGLTNLFSIDAEYNG